jgi:hypothetical protein
VSDITALASAKSLINLVVTPGAIPKAQVDALKTAVPACRVHEIDPVNVRAGSLQ